MTSTIANASTRPACHETRSATERRSSPWVGLGLLAGPLFLGASLLQALLRPGFDLTRNAVSLLSLGHLGWIQDANFAVSGALSLIGAIGVRRAIRSGVGATWLPRLLGVVGVGLAGASICHPDPGNGFPPGTPPGASAISTWHGALHMVCGSAAFLALIVACFVFGRRFSRSGDRRWAIACRTAGLAFALALTMSGGHDGSVILFAGVSLGWLAVTTATLYAVRSLGSPDRSRPTIPLATN